MIISLNGLKEQEKLDQSEKENGRDSRIREESLRGAASQEGGAGEIREFVRVSRVFASVAAGFGVTFITL